MINLAVFEKNLKIFYEAFKKDFLPECEPTLEETRDILLRGKIDAGHVLWHTEGNVWGIISYDPYVTFLASVVIKNIEDIRAYTNSLDKLEAS